MGVHLSENWGKKCSIFDKELFFGFHLNLGKKGASSPEVAKNLLLEKNATNQTWGVPKTRGDLSPNNLAVSPPIVASPPPII